MREHGSHAAASSAGTPPPPWYRVQDQRNPNFDGLRGIAILLVMLYHLTFFPNATGPIDIAVSTFTSMGWSGVDLFFVLSGFLITGILYENRDADHYFRAFYARRVLRIFPLYYAVLIFFLIVMPRLTTQEAQFWVGGQRDTIWYWLYLSNFHAAFTGYFHHHFLGISWSLAIEEQFYLVWPLVVYFSNGRRLVRICIGILIGALLLRIAAVAAGASSTFLWTFTPCRLDTLAAGALLAVLSRDPASLRRLRDGAHWAFPLLLFAIAAFVASVRAFPALQWRTAGAATTDAAFAFLQNPLMQTLGFSALWALYGSALILALTAPEHARLSRALRAPPLRVLGKYSYAIYLLHVFGGEIARNFFDPTRYPAHFLAAQVAFWGLGIAITYLLALLTWYAIEVHFLELKKYFPYRSREQS